MMGFGGLLNDDEAAAVLSYVRLSFGNNGKVVSPSTVKKVREATKDRIHQDIRLAASPACAAALQAGLDAGAWCGWLSGSGPTVALMCDPATADAVAAALPTEGHAKKLTIDFDGAVVL
jgi:homoserine kinase